MTNTEGLHEYLPSGRAEEDTLILADDAVRAPSATEWMIAHALGHDNAVIEPQLTTENDK
jgi:elongation factor P hydroxylase